MRQNRRTFAKAHIKIIQDAIKEADWASAQIGIEIAQANSSGTVTTAMMRTAEYGPHPFSKKRATTLLPAWLINKQTGKFRDSWRLRKRAMNRNPVIQNTDPIAVYLERGTKKMHRRPVDEAIKKQLLPIRLQNFKRFIQQLKNR